MNTKKNTFTNLLKENREYKKLFYGQTFSVLGDWFHTIALLGFVYSETKSTFMLALTFISKGLPQLLLSPFIGYFVDRCSKKQIMFYTDVIRGVIVLGFLLAYKFIWIIFILNILLAILQTLFEPARQGAIKYTVKKEQIVIANSLSSTINGFMSVVGASLGGMVAELLSVQSAFLINSLSFFISACFIYSSKIPNNLEKKTTNRFYTDIKEGYKFIIHNKIILTLILVGMSWGVIGGAYQLFLTYYGEEVFHSGSTGIGLLYTIQGMGMIIGGFIVKHFIGSDDYKMKKAFGLAYLFQGVFFLLFILSSTLSVGCMMLLFMRIAGGVIIPLDTTFIQNHTDDDKIGKVFSFHYSIYSSLINLSMFVSGILLERISPKVLGLFLSILCIFISLIWLYMYYFQKLNEKKDMNKSASCH
jgi:predicted MFS family arabinose efflux permease